MKSKNNDHKISKFLSYFLMPALFAGYHFTQHDFFLFLISIASFIFTIMLIMMAGFIVILTSRNMKLDSVGTAALFRAVKIFKTAPFYKFLHSLILWIGGSWLLFHWEAYVTLGFFVAFVLGTLVIMFLFQMIAKGMEKICEELDLDVDGLIKEVENAKE